MEFKRETRETDGKRYVEMEYTNKKGETKVLDNRTRVGMRGAVPKTHPEDASFKLTKVTTYLPKDLKVAYSDIVSVSVSVSSSSSPSAEALKAKEDAKAARKAATLARKASEKEVKAAVRLAAKMAKSASKDTSAEGMDMDMLLLSKHTHVTDIEVIAELPLGALLTMPNSTFEGVSAFKFRVKALFAGVKDGKVYCITDVDGKSTKLPNRHGFYIPNDGKYPVKAI
jgi:hypothetical protein